MTSHLYFQLLDAIQSTSDAAEVDAILDQHRAEGLDERHWRDIQETAMQHKEALRLAAARDLGGAMADKERDDYGPPNPRWPTRSNPADLLLAAEARGEGCARGHHQGGEGRPRRGPRGRLSGMACRRAARTGAAGQ